MYKYYICDKLTHKNMYIDAPCPKKAMKKLFEILNLTEEPITVHKQAHNDKFKARFTGFEVFGLSRSFDYNRKGFYYDAIKQCEIYE